MTVLQLPAIGACLSTVGSSLVMLVLGSAECRSFGDALCDRPPPEATAAAFRLARAADQPPPRALTEALLSGREPTPGESRLLNPFLRACGPAALASGQAAAASPAARAGVCAVWSEIDARWNARDAEGFSELFAGDVSFRFVQRDESLDGRTTVLEYFGERFPRFAPDLRHRTRLHRIDEVGPNQLTADGIVEILREPGNGAAAPVVIRRFEIFALMSGADERFAIRVLRIYELPAEP